MQKQVRVYWCKSLFTMKPKGVKQTYATFTLIFPFTEWISSTYMHIIMAHDQNTFNETMWNLQKYVKNFFILANINYTTADYVNLQVPCKVITLYFSHSTDRQTDKSTMKPTQWHKFWSVFFLLLTELKFCIVVKLRQMISTSSLLNKILVIMYNISTKLERHTVWSTLTFQKCSSCHFTSGGTRRLFHW
jgi:hypothetical protein